MENIFNPAGFGLGFIALLNPCSFALLPSYLGLFLNLKDPDSDQHPTMIRTLNRAQIVSLVMTLGIVTVFGIVGIVFSGITGALGEFLPWFSIFMGIGLFILGIAMLKGYELVLKIPKLSKGGTSSTLGGIYLYGVSYAIAAIGCSAPLVALAIGTGTTSKSQQFGSLFSFGVGMGAALSIITLAVALGKQGVVNTFRKIIPKINKVSAVILLFAGLYLAYYGYWSTNPIDIPQGPVAYVISAEASLGAWLRALINPFGLLAKPMQRSNVLGLIFLTINAILIIAGGISKKTSKKVSTN